MTKKEHQSSEDIGKADVRFSDNTGKYRLRFYGVSPDQKETILTALEKCRLEAETSYDTVALEAICMNYLSGGNVTLK